MQNIPDSLRGFQPDMDPDLREVLEALEDDIPRASNDSSGEDPEDIFAELVKGVVVDETNLDDDNGYESDDTVKGRERDITGSEYLTEMAQFKVPARPQDDTDSLA